MFRIRSQHAAAFETACIPCADCENLAETLRTYKDKFKPQLFGVINYGHWCGPDHPRALRPAPDGGAEQGLLKRIETCIPEEESQWEEWAEKHGLPDPVDGVDRACFFHDLRLGFQRQAYRSNFSTFAGDYNAAAINARLALDFAIQSRNPSNNIGGLVFAYNASPFFVLLSAYNLGGMRLKARWETTKADARSIGAAACYAAAALSTGARMATRTAKAVVTDVAKGVAAQAARAAATVSKAVSSAARRLAGVFGFK